MASQDQTSSNPFLAKETGAENTKPKSMDYHRQMMEKKLKESQGESGPAYVSPSDAIMSPASQKLSGFKQRQMNKQMGAPLKPRSLFASTTTREKDLSSEEPQQEEGN